MVATALCLLAFAVVPDATIAAAYSDYYQQRALGYDCRYLTVSDQQEPVAKFVAVLASREPLLDSTVPVRIHGTNLLRLNLTALRWSIEDWGKLAGHPSNPYSPHTYDTLIIPAGYFIDRVSDQTRSDAFLRLYFGGKNIPKTLNEFLARSGGIDRKAQRSLEQLHVEGQSGVNVAGNGARLVEFLDGLHATGFVTYDTKQVVPGSDPLEQLDRNFKVDGIEVFVLTPKVSTLGTRGVFPVTALANGQEKLVAEAPVDLVVDHVGTGGVTSIRNVISCIGCHSASQPLSVNALRDRLQKGVELLSYDKQRRVEIELKHLSSMEAALASWDEGYREALAVVNGMSPAKNSQVFRQVVNEYRADLTLETAADELCCEAESLRLAIAYASSQKIVLSNRLISLSHDVPCPRPAFESGYLQLVEVLRLWRNATHPIQGKVK